MALSASDLCTTCNFHECLEQYWRSAAVFVPFRFIGSHGLKREHSNSSASTVLFWFLPCCGENSERGKEHKETFCWNSSFHSHSWGHSCLSEGVFLWSSAFVVVFIVDGCNHFHFKILRLWIEWRRKGRVMMKTVLRINDMGSGWEVRCDGTGQVC